MPKALDNAYTFAEQFDPPLNVVQTQHINGMRVKEAYTVAWADGNKGIGLTAVFLGPEVRAYFEFIRRDDNAATQATGAMKCILDSFNA